MAVKFKLGQIVNIKVDYDKTPYMITGYLKRARHTMYECSSATDVQFKFDYEIEIKNERGEKTVTGFKNR